MSGLMQADYNLPTSGESSYLKFSQGENRFRILAPPVTGYQYWQDDRAPIRIKTASEAPQGEKIKHFWQVLVYSGGAVKILDITQATVQSKLLELDRNSEWGNLLDYDVIVTRSGEGMDTTYSVTPCPKSKLDSNVADLLKTFREDYNPEEVFKSTPSAESAKEEKLPF
tara:strand:+ start:1211 stop:1717 length:507 start_codon:yes stop_codon:yes gene_type:complete